MKNKISKYILLIIGIFIIVFGAFIPKMFKKNIDNFDFSHYTTFNYYAYEVTVISDDNFEIESATVYLIDVFNEYNTLQKTIEGSSVTKSQTNGKYVYKFDVELTQTEYFDFNEIDYVSLNTNIGDRTAIHQSTIHWTSIVKGFVIFIGGAITFAGVIMIFVNRSQAKTAQRLREQMAKTNPEINTNNMTDAEVFAKHGELNRKKEQENPTTLASVLGLNQTPKEKMCEYCGSLNDANAKKCSSCGASLGKKK